METDPLPTLTFNNSNPTFYNNTPTYSSLNTQSSNNYYTTITYTYNLKSEQNYSDLKITSINTENIKYQSNLLSLNPNEIATFTNTTIDIYTYPFKVNIVSSIPTINSVSIKFIYSIINNPRGYINNIELISSNTGTLSSSFTNPINIIADNTTERELNITGLSQGTSYTIQIKFSDSLGETKTETISVTTLIGWTIGPNLLFDGENPIGFKHKGYTNANSSHADGPKKHYISSKKF